MHRGSSKNRKTPDRKINPVSPVHKGGVKENIALSDDWNKKDYESARTWIAAHEEDAQESAILETPNGLAIVLPKGLPALGAGFHGCIMLSPIPVIMAILLLIPIFMVFGDWPVNATTLSITAGCLVLIGALFYILRLMTRNRDLFPRKYFVTLGDEGVAMHFSLIHFPYRSPKAFIPWKEFHSLKRVKSFFFPSIFIGAFSVPAIEMTSTRGETVIVPINLPSNKMGQTLNHIEALVAGKIKI